MNDRPNHGYCNSGHYYDLLLEQCPACLMGEEGAEGENPVEAAVVAALDKKLPPEEWGV